MSKIIKPKVSSKALEEAAAKAAEQEEEMVQLVALTMRPNNKIQVQSGMGFYFAEVKALGLSPKVPKSYAESVTKPRDLNDPRIKPAIVWHPLPEPRPKNSKTQSFEREVDGRKVRFETDTYAPSRNLIINGRQIHHSVSQAQHFISHCLTTIPGVQRFITEFDNRAAVAQWGNYVINVLTRKEQQNMGMSGNTTPVIS